jgi:hypothetical protein
VGSPDVEALAQGWVAGSQTTDGVTTATSVQTDFSVPQDNAISGNNFQVFLGTYDNHNGYDEVGMASLNGKWGFFYSAGNPYCGGVSSENYNDYSLVEGQSYTFEISINVAASTMTFSVNALDTQTSFASYTESTPATAFDLNNLATCSGDPGYLLPGWTTAEYVGPDSGNVFGTPIPIWNFVFSNSKYCIGATCYGVPVSSLGSYYSPWAPNWLSSTDGSPEVTFTGSTPAVVHVSNQFYSMSESANQIYVSPGSRGTITESLTVAYSICNQGCTVSLAPYTTLPSGVTVTFSPTSGTVPVSSTVTVSASSTYSGTPWIGIGATAAGLDPPGYTTAGFELVVSGSGGGCVATGTPILTTTGYVQVQKLKLGSQVLGYNLSSGSFMKLTLQWANVSTVSQILEINGGLLNVTSTNQPVYMENSSFVGWLRDPINLAIGDFIFNPVKNNWIPITNLSLMMVKIKVFDVVTNGLNNFIANGILLDKK